MSGVQGSGWRVAHIPARCDRASRAVPGEARFLGSIQLPGRIRGRIALRLTIDAMGVIAAAEHTLTVRGGEGGAA